MFEAGAIAYRLQMVGAQVFTAQAAQADLAVTKLGRSSQTSVTNIERSGAAALAASKQYGTMSAAGERAFTGLGRVMLGAGLAAAAMVALSVYKFAQYDKALSSLDSVVQATDTDLNALGETAIDTGREFGYSATQAISAEEALAKAGVGVNDIMGGALLGSLTLAAAGTLDVGEAAEVAAIAMVQFKRDGAEVPHIADLLAAGAGKAVGDVKDLALALRQGGLVAAQFKIPLEDTVGTLAAFAANGLIGSDAGTSFKQMLLSLATPSVKQAGIMRELGISAYDTSGNFVGMANFAGILHDKLDGLTDAERQNALGWIFGSDAIRAASVLYDEGASGIQEWIDKTNDSGYAADQARRKLDNLSGDVTKLGSSFDRALIKSGSAANDTLRDMIQTVTQLTDWYGDLDPEAQKAALAIGAGTAAVLLLGGTVFSVLPKIIEFRANMDYLQLSMKKTTLAAGGIAVGLGIVLLILGKVASNAADARAKTAAYGDTLGEITDDITKYTREQVKANLATTNGFGHSAYDNARTLGVSLELVTDAAIGNVDALRRLKIALDDAMNGTIAQKRAAQELILAVTGESGSVDKAIRIAEQKREADGQTVDANGQVQGSYDDVQEAVDGVITSVQDLAKELAEANGQHLNQRDALRALEQAYDDFDASIAANGNTLDITTQAGRDNQSALDGIAQAALDSAQAIVDAGGGYDQYRASLEGSRTELMQRITDLGLGADAAGDLANEILHIPSATEWEAIVKVDQARADMDRFIADYKNLKIPISAVVRASDRVNQADGGRVNFYANGGGTEQHIAQFARAGTIRVWNEPETEGEWYIPRAMSKRPRSVQIAKEMADDFGYEMVPRGGQRFADGTAPAGMSVSSGRTQRRIVSGTVRIIDDRTGQLELIEQELR